MKLYRFTLINFEINRCNGFLFDLIGIETEESDRSFFCLNFSKDFLLIHLFFFEFYTEFR